MARNGSGTFALTATMATPNAVSNSTTVNAVMEDVADALTDSINKDGTKAFAANQSMGGNKLTSLASGTATTDAANVSQVQAGRINWADAGGTADAITGTYTPAPTALTDGDLFYVRAADANATITPTFTPNSGTLTARTIVKTANQALAVGDIAGDGHELILRYRASDTKYELLNPKATSISTSSTTEVLSGTDPARAVTPDALAALWEKGSDVASAGTLTLGEGGYFHVTGTTTITDIDFGTAKDGRKAILVFDGALTLTHNSTTLVCPTGASITTAAGDTCLVVQDSSDNVKIAWYQRADGKALAATSSAPVFIAQLAGTTVQAATSIPQYTTILVRYSFNTISSTASPVIALSSDDGSSYGSDRNLAGTLTLLGLGIGTATISNTKNNGASKVITPSVLMSGDLDTSGSSSVYTTTATENVVTGIINAIKITPSGGNGFQAELWGIP